jgi:hypothetical protein
MMHGSIEIVKVRFDGRLIFTYYVLQYDDDKEVGRTGQTILKELSKLIGSLPL